MIFDTATTVDSMILQDTTRTGKIFDTATITTTTVDTTCTTV